MPRSILLGRQRRTVTTYQYDDAGRLASSVSIEDPEWLDEDFDAAASLHEIHAGSCPGCGHDVVESYDDEWRAAWIAEPVTCWACAARDRAATHHDPGVRYRVVKRDP